MRFRKQLQAQAFRVTIYTAAALTAVLCVVALTNIHLTHRPATQSRKESAHIAAQHPTHPTQPVSTNQSPDTPQLPATNTTASQHPSTPSAPKSYGTPTPTQPAPTSPDPNQGFDLAVDSSKISSDGTNGIYFPFQVIRKGGFTGPITPSGVHIDPQGVWPNSIGIRSYFMLTADSGAFILEPSMYHPVDVTITITAFSNSPYHEASYSFQYHFPNSYY